MGQATGLGFILFLFASLLFPRICFVVLAARRENCAGEIECHCPVRAVKVPSAQPDRRSDSAITWFKSRDLIPQKCPHVHQRNTRSTSVVLRWIWIKLNQKYTITWPSFGTCAESGGWVMKKNQFQNKLLVSSKMEDLLAQNPPFNTGFQVWNFPLYRVWVVNEWKWTSENEGIVQVDGRGLARKFSINLTFFLASMVSSDFLPTQHLVFSI